MPTRAKIKRVSRARKVVAPRRTSGATLEELLAFERLLSDLSVRFANVVFDQIIAEIESALKLSAFDITTASLIRTEWYQAVRRFFEKYEYLKI